MGVVHVKIMEKGIVTFPECTGYRYYAPTHTTYVNQAKVTEKKVEHKIRRQYIKVCISPVAAHAGL